MVKNIRRLIGGICIITALLLVQIPARLTEAASYAREDYLIDNNTLVKYTGTATTVSVSDDIKIIGEEAFANNQYIGAVNFGKNVKVIEHGAFANCNYLNRVVIPNSVREIDSAAFSACYNLRNISLGDSIEILGDGVFAACSNLGGISVSRKNNNFKFEAGVLYDNTMEHLYTYLNANPYSIYYMPNSVKNISPYSFWGNNNLEEVYLSGDLEEIPAYSFSNCRNLKMVQIPYSVDSIDAKAFENCISLGNVTIPASVKYIDPSAFDGCINLNIIADEGTAAYEFFYNFDKSDVSNSESQDVRNLVNSIRDLDENHEYHENGLIDASKDPSNVEWMPSVNPLIGHDDSSVLGKTIIVDGRAVFFVNREMEINQLTNEDVTGVIDNGSSSDSTNDKSLIYDSDKGGYLPKYTYINGNIASQAFYASNNMDDFIISNGTKKIGKFSFARSSIEETHIPEGVESIGYGAFYHCDNLKNVSIPSSVKEIEGYAFENTPFMAEFKKRLGSSNFMVVGDGILLAYSGTDKNIAIPEGVKSIVSGCFENNTIIESVLLPQSLKTIGSDAFRDCANLCLVSGGNNVEVINDRAFMGCPLNDFVINESVKKIGLKAFDFSSTSLNDDKKLVVFKGKDLPSVSYDATSMRLSNYDYRKDALYNVIFAIVDEDILEFDNTVLDNDTLGFSGMILSLDNNSKRANVKKNYIYSQEVLDRLPNKVVVNGVEYELDLSNVNLANNPYSNIEKTKDIIVDDDIDGYDVRAVFSENEACSKLTVRKSEIAKNILNNSYSLLFGGDYIDGLDAYEIELLDDKGIVTIDKLGKASIYITLPVSAGNGKYHAITLDEDGQLEELPAIYNENEKTITFETSHLSYFGIYASDNNVVLNYKEGKLVRNYKLDESPNTGDNSISIYYVISLALLSIGLFLILMKKKKTI